MPTNTNDEEPSLKVLKVAVNEQRRFHDELTGSFRGLRTKIITFIGAILALLTFLYAGATTTKVPETRSTVDRLFFPSELYGQIFYLVGLTCLIYALAKLVHGAKPDAQWSVPFEQSDFASLKDTDERVYLEKLKDEYVKATDNNLRMHAKKSEAMKDSFYPMLVGGILLVVLRYFQ